MVVNQFYVVEVVCEDVGVQLSGLNGYQDDIELDSEKVLVAG